MNPEMFSALIAVGNNIVGAIKELSDKIEAVEVSAPSPEFDNVTPDPPTVGDLDLGDNVT